MSQHTAIVQYYNISDEEGLTEFQVLIYDRATQVCVHSYIKNIAWLTRLLKGATNPPNSFTLNVTKVVSRLHTNSLGDRVLQQWAEENEATYDNLSG